MKKSIRNLVATAITVASGISPVAYQAQAETQIQSQSESQESASPATATTTTPVPPESNEKFATPENLPVDMNRQPPADPTKEKKEPTIYAQKLKMLTPAELQKLMVRRIGGSIGQDFATFAGSFFVRSKVDSDVGIGLASKSGEIMSAQLEAAFPSDYMPTTREFLDAIAAETNSRWAYEEAAQVINTESEETAPIEGLAIFEFFPDKKPINFEMTPAKGWHTQRRTNWVMYIPPSAPQAMDFHLMGHISCDDKSKEAEVLAKAPIRAALDNYKRVKSTAVTRDLQKVKVGPYDAYFFEHNLPMQTGENIRWRQWHFMIGDQLCYIISTIPKDKDAELYPDVEAMIKTFHQTGEH